GTLVRSNSPVRSAGTPTPFRASPTHATDGSSSLAVPTEPSRSGGWAGSSGPGPQSAPTTEARIQEEEHACEAWASHCAPVRAAQGWMSGGRYSGEVAISESIKKQVPWATRTSDP